MLALSRSRSLALALALSFLTHSLLGVHAALLGEGGEGQALGVGHVAVRRKAAGLCSDKALRVRNIEAARNVH